MQKKILVTGGAGFIGSALVRHVISNTNNSIINIDKLTEVGNLESLKTIENHSNYLFEKVDICSFSDISQIFKKHQPDIVMHLAAESHVDRSIYGPEKFIQTNIFGTYVLLEASREYFLNLDKLKKDNFRFHHISTDEVYGDIGLISKPSDEKTPYAPSSPYSATKASSDHLVRSWGRTFNLPILITNSSNNYGPYQYPEKLIPFFITRALKGKSLPVYGDGKQIRDWLYVDDHVRALLLVALNGEIGETYNIGGNNEMQNIEVIKIICKILNELVPNKPNGINNYEQLITYVEDRPGHDVRYAIDSSKINNKFNWKPEEDFSTGITKTIKWYLENLAWCKLINTNFVEK